MIKQIVDSDFGFRITNQNKSKELDKILIDVDTWHSWTA